MFGSGVFELEAVCACTGFGGKDPLPAMKMEVCLWDKTGWEPRDREMPVKHG